MIDLQDLDTDIASTLGRAVGLHEKESIRLAFTVLAKHANRAFATNPHELPDERQRIPKIADPDLTARPAYVDVIVDGVDEKDGAKRAASFHDEEAQPVTVESWWSKSGSWRWGYVEYLHRALRETQDDLRMEISARVSAEQTLKDRVADFDGQMRVRLDDAEKRRASEIAALEAMRDQAQRNVDTLLVERAKAARDLNAVKKERDRFADEIRRQASRGHELVATIKALETKLAATPSAEPPLEGREVMLRLSSYERDNLLALLEATKRTHDTGDWHGQIRFRLLPKELGPGDPNWNDWEARALTPEIVDGLRMLDSGIWTTPQPAIETAKAWLARQKGTK